MTHGGFSQPKLERYARQIVLPGVGGKGQRRLREASVAVVGAGGLGSPALLYLAAAGVGRLIVIDADEVDLSNLQRQILHDETRIGTAKTESAEAALARVNSTARVEAKDVRLVADNAAELLREADIVLDGSDNFATRYAVADACAGLGIPLVSGSLFRFEGQLALFPHDGPDAACYRCLYPAAPPPGTTPSCAEAGVLGPVAGVIGSLMAVEAIKHLIGLGESMAGRLLVYDGLSARFDEFAFRRRAECDHSAMPQPKET